MKFKSLSIYLLASSIFLLCLLSILKIMSTLQGIDFTNLNIGQNFILGICLSLGLLVVGNKLNHLIKIFSFTSIFTIFYLYINESAPIWYYISVFIVILFFSHKVKNYNLNYLKETLEIADLFYESSFASIKKIPLSFRFSILVARRVYRKIGYKILNKQNIENYKKSGKIYVSNIEKIIETLLVIEQIPPSIDRKEHLAIKS